ncbi:hypothetical protein ACF1BU_37440 [Streptomyces sp. NPDC014724]|uniref:hypothetical protein n=1 Tax=unclassified Streptomyces TaxID=2593676 RepID=UPI0036FFD0B4
MSTSDQDHAVDSPIADPEAASKTAPAAVPEAVPTQAPETVPESASRTPAHPVPGASAEAVAETAPEAAPAADPETAAETGERRLTPRQARRLRIVLSSIGMAAMAVVLALRIASRSSVLVVGVYGLALILCGIVIELSRNGRTRLGSWLLAVGLLAAIGSDWLLIP